MFLLFEISPALKSGARIVRSVEVAAVVVHV